MIESAPAWDRAEPDRGVVVQGPVGLAWLGRSKWFRYAVRCWRDGIMPDAAQAVDSPPPASAPTVSRRKRSSRSHPRSRRSPWGRDELGNGNMWNSNSLVACLLAGSGHDLDVIRPPARGRAPGWSAGLAAAHGGHVVHGEPSSRAMPRHP